MASVEFESIPTVEIHPAPITPETPASIEAPTIVEPPASDKETPKEIEATPTVVELPESENSGGTKDQEDEVSAEPAGDVVPIGEAAAEEIEVKEESPPADETVPNPTVEEFKATAELEGELDPPKLEELDEVEKNADVAE